ncbi:MAG TPA: FadR/GntR family transcriptional regulator [Rectinemataceae bacterium]
MAKLHRVKTDSLRAQIYVQLKNQLLNGAWKPGEKLPSENQLCETFGVSRVTVRAALQQLEILGMVKTKHGGGTYALELPAVITINNLQPTMLNNRNHDIITVLEYRKIIEKGTIGLAVEKICNKDFEYLEETYKTMQASVDDHARFAQADFSFHLRIAEIANNPIINNLYHLINQIMTASMSDIVDLLGCEIGLYYHRKLIDALKARDKPACESEMEKHIDVTIQAIVNESNRRQAGEQPAFQAANQPPST